MDQTQWSDGSEGTLAFFQVDDQHYSTVAASQSGYSYGVQGLTSGVNSYVVQLADGSTTIVNADSVISSASGALQISAPQKQSRRQGGRQGNASHMNGGNRQSKVVETSVVSLLTGQEQRISVHEQRKPETNKSQASSKSSGRQHQVSLLQSNWQNSQAEQVVDAGQMEEVSLQLQNAQQGSQIYSDGQTEVRLGDKMYTVIDGIPYEIMTDPSTGQQYAIAVDLSQQTMEMASVPVGSTGIGLNELADISAEQETLKLIDYQSVIPDGAQAVINQEQSLSGSDQQYIDMVQESSDNAGTSDQETIQITTVTGEGEQGHQSLVVPAGGVDMKQNLQEMLLQELVTKGFDLSNCQVYIQESEDGQSNESVYMTTSSDGSYAHGIQPQLVSMVNGSGEFISYVTSQAGAGDVIQPVAYVNSGVDGNNLNQTDVLTILAEASSAVAIQEQHHAGDGQTKLITLSAVAPEEDDDGEFDHLKEDTEAVHQNSLIVNHGPLNNHAVDQFQNSFTDFLNGHKPETLASVANSTVLKKPQLPSYVPELCRRTARDSTGTPGRGPQTMTVVYTNDSGHIIEKVGMSSIKPPVKRIRRDTGAEETYGTETQQHGVRISKVLIDKEGKIVKRKRRGSDEDSFDGSDPDDLTGDIDPSWKPGSDGQKTRVVAEYVPQEPTPNRGRGRPRLSGRGRGGARVESQRPMGTPATAAFTPIDLNEPHNYQKGDFVIERKDRYKYDGFPIWKIESGRLLQKFDPVSNDQCILHKSVSIYSSWSGDVRTNFKAIQVEVITSTGRKCEIAKVLESYLPKPPDEILEQDSLMSLFNIYVQVLVSQAIDATFFTSIEQGHEYYSVPMEQIDSLLVQAENSVLALIGLTEKFKAAIDERPFYKITEPHSDARLNQAACEAVADGSQTAIKNVKFYGPLYDRKSLEITSEGKMLASQEFIISQIAATRLATYHGLHHFKFHLFKKCQEEVQFIKQTRHGITDNDIVEEILKNRVFVQQDLQELKTMLDNCSIVITVISKQDDEGLE